MLLQLDEREVHHIRRLLEQELAAVRGQYHHTKGEPFRIELKHQENFIWALLEKLDDRPELRSSASL